MLSTKPITHAAKATHYFLGHDNYYTEHQTLAQERSQWWGSGAKSLELSGKTVDPKEFTRLLEGHLPNGEQMGKMVDGQLRHRPGFDLTFSAPKSVSLVALLGNDERIFKAIEKATDKALTMIEREHAKTRVRQSGKMIAERTGQLVVARFLHDLSREGDPQLHTHCVVMNMTLRQDGQWRSLASQLGSYKENTLKMPDGFFEGVRHHQKYYGAVFRAELAYELRQLGYTIEKTGEHGFFEIAGISKDSIKAFSQRRQDIEALLKTQGWQGAKAADVITLMTRKSKQDICREHLDQLWKTKADLHQVPVFQEVQKTVAQACQQLPFQTRENNPALNNLAHNALIEAIAHLSEIQAALRETELMRRAIYYLVGDVPVSAVVTALQAAKQNGALIPLPTTAEYRGEMYFTTPALICDEQHLLQAVMRQHTSGHAVVKASVFNTFITGRTDLTVEQRQAMQMVFSSAHTIMAIAGPTGSGKTHLLAPMIELAQIGGYQPMVLTPHAVHVLDLKKQLQKTPENLREWFQQLFEKKRYETVSGFLHRQEKLSAADVLFQKKPLIFVENAMLLCSRQLCALVTQTERLKGRLVVMGDPHSCLPWQVGSPFTQMLTHGVAAAHLSGNHRTVSEPLKAAVSDTLQGHLSAAFNKIGQRVVSIEDSVPRWEAMAAHFIALSNEERSRAMVLAPTRVACDALNQAIRDALKNSGVVARQEITTHALLPHTMRWAEQRIARHYTAGQWIRFHRDYISLGVRSGDYRKIMGIEAGQNRLILARAEGKGIHRWNPEKVREGSIEVFDSRSRALAVGDCLLWRRTDRAHKLTAGERVTVIAVNEKNITLMRDSGEKLKKWDFGNMASRHFEYGYALTPWQTRHTCADIVIAYQNSFSRQSHQRAFYQLLGQAKEQAWIYTENKLQLLETLQKHTGNKITAIDCVLQSDPQRSSAGVASIEFLEKALQKAIADCQKMAIKTPEGTAQAAVRYALAHLSEKEAAFTHKDVLTVALTHALGDVGMGHIQQAVIKAEKNGDLVRGLYSENGTHWTTRDTLTLERDILMLAKVDRGTMPPLAAAETVSAYLQKNQPSVQHARVIKEFFSQTDRVCLLQGFAGTGKTTLLQHVEAIQHIQSVLNTQDRQDSLLCLAPTHSAVKEIRARELVGKTLDRFLLEYRAGKINPATYDGGVIVVDESSMVSNRRLHDFLIAVKQLNARSFLIGDTHQYTAIDSGKPFAILQQAGVRTLTITEITRQKDEALKKAVHELYQKNFSRVFKLLEKNTIEVGSEWVGEKRLDNRSIRLEAIRDDYLNRDSVRRAQTLIVTFGNDDRILQNALIREGLKQRGELSGNPVITTVLMPQRLSEVERTQVSHYQIGDRVRFNTHDAALGVEKGDYWSVKAIYREQNTLELEKWGRDPMLWKPRAWTGKDPVGVEIYRQEQRELLVGDLIRWTRSDEKLGLLSPELAEVTAVSSHTLEVRSLQMTDQGRMPHGVPIRLSPTDPRMQHWDHAYAMTSYSAQGKTISEVIINAESYRPKLTSQPSLLVAITRAVNCLTLYTDDKDALLRAVLQQPGDKTSALEMMGEVRKSMPAVRPSAMPSPDKWSEPRLDARRISDLLTDQAERVVTRLLGEPKIKTGGQYRYGHQQGSLVVTLQGDKRGLWHDFQTGEGGNLLSLIALQKNLNLQRDFKAVLQEALRVLGTSSADLTVQKALPIEPSKPPQATKAMTPAQQVSLRYARQLARESQPLAGTLAERYLREQRGIVLDKFPDSIRFHPGIYSKKNADIHPALLVVAKDSAGEVKAVQAVFLDKDTAQKANVPIKKQTWGLPSQAAVQMSKTWNPLLPTYLAEGAETALSIYAALGGADVRITLGKSNFKNIDAANAHKNIVLCLDNDGKNPNSEKLIHFAAERLISQEKTVWVAQPKQAGQDYNDVLIQQGQAAVKSELLRALPYVHYRDQSPSELTLQSVLKSQCAGIDKVELTQEAQYGAAIKNAAIKLNSPAKLTDQASTFLIQSRSEYCPENKSLKENAVKIPEKEPEL